MASTVETTARPSKTHLLVSVDKRLPKTVICDLLVVACDPRNLKDACRFTSQERDIFDAFPTLRPTPRF